MYASIRTQDTPMAQNIMSEQQDWRWALKDMLRVVLRERVKHGNLARTFSLSQFTVESQEAMSERLSSMIKDGATQDVLLDELSGMSKDANTKNVRIATEEYPVDVKFPAIVQEDPLKMAQESEVLHRTGIVSRHTLASKHGVRWDEEARRILVERELLGESEDPEVVAPGVVKPKKKTDSKPAKTTTEEK